MIRSARDEDVAAIEQIARDAYHVYEERLGRPPAPMIADFKRHLARDWVIVFEGNDASVSGYAVLRVDERRALLDNIAVDPGHQRSGIGQALITAVERQAMAHGHKQLELYTNVVMTENIGWYEKLGFVETRRIVEDGFHRIYMKREIAPRP